MTSVEDAFRSSPGREHIPADKGPAFDLRRQNVLAQKQDFSSVKQSKLAQGLSSSSSFRLVPAK